MKSKAEIQAELEMYEGIEAFNYAGPNPMVEYIRQQDLGFRNALEWILGINKLKAEDGTRG